MAGLPLDSPLTQHLSTPGRFRHSFDMRMRRAGQEETHRVRRSTEESQKSVLKNRTTALHVKESHRSLPVTAHFIFYALLVRR